MRRLAGLVAFSLLLTACSQASVSVSEVPELPETSAEDVRSLLAASERPVVLNVWASWCAPCRSEAPLLRAAQAETGDEILFIGVDVRDTQDAAREFIAEFGLGGFEHYFDATGAVPNDLAGRGVPLTFFFAPGGALVTLHSGVIDERTLALQLDELARLGD